MIDRARLAELRVRRLHGAEPGLRLWYQLVAMGDSAVAPVARELASADPDRRRWAAVVLNRIATPAAWTALGANLGDPEPSVGLYAAMALAWLSDVRALPTLVRLSRAGVLPWMRWEAFAGLGFLGDPLAVPILVDAMREPDWNVANQARAAFAQLGVRAIPAIRPLLADRDPALREAAISVFARVADPGHLPEVLGLRTDPAPSVRAAVARALARFRDSGPPVARALEAALGDPDPSVRRSACRSLGALGSAGAVDAVAPLLSDPDPGVRHEACEALGRLGAVALLAPLLSSPDLAEEVVCALVRARSPLPPEARWLLSDKKRRKGLRRSVRLAWAESRRGPD